MVEAKKTVRAVSNRVTEKKGESFWSASVPMYISILLLLLGLVAGFVFHLVFFPAPVITPPDQNNFSPSLQLWVLTHPDCKLCSNESSLALLLQQRNVDANVVLVSATSEPGRNWVSALDIDSFPTTLVNSESLREKDPALFATLRQSFSLKNEWMVLPEKDLMIKTNVFSPFMLATVPSIAACSPSSTRVTVWEFGNDLFSQTYDALPSITRVWDDLNTVLDYSFKHFQLVRSGYGIDAERVAMADACAEEHGFFQRYHKALLERYHGLRYPIWERTEQRGVAERVGLPDLNDFLSCVDQNRFASRVNFDGGTDTFLGNAFDLQALVSAGKAVFVVDCRFVVPAVSNLKETICLQRPDLQACEQS